MKKTNRIGFMVSTLLLVAGLALLPQTNRLKAHAEASGTVTAASAKIRKSPDTGSEVVGSALSGAKVTIKSQTTGADGNTWYEVYITGGQTGYTRSDLIQKGEGSIPTSSASVSAPAAAAAPAAPATPAVMAPTVEVTALEPIGGTISGGQSVRVRADASTSSGIVATVAGGTAVTVSGQATGADGKTWYQISFAEATGEVAGFVRSDFLTLSGEAVPAASTEPPVEEVPVVTEEVEPVAEVKEYDTALQGDTWYLLHNTAGVQYKIGELIDAARINAENYQKSLETIKRLKLGLIILAVLAVVALGAFVFLLFRRRNEEEDMYFGEPDSEPVVPAREKRPRPLRDKGETADNRPSRPAPGARPAGIVRPASGARPTGARPEGAPRPAGARPEGAPRPAGARPEGAPRPTGARPEGAPRPTGARPEGAPRPTGARPEGAQRPTGARPAGTGAKGATAPGGAGRSAVSAHQEKAGVKENEAAWKSKNFIEDDDEFEFEFLNWDEEK